MQDWVVEIVRQMGVAGVALLMFAENAFPPLPSEIIMPLAGYLSSRDEMELGPAIAAGAAGSVAGATFWYWIGRRVPYDRLCEWLDRHGIWLAMTPADVDRAVEWFHGSGRYSVLLGRLFPLVRTLISVPAGFSRMPMPRFLLLTTIGTVIWTSGLAYVGLVLGRGFPQIQYYIGYLTWAVVAGAAAWYVYRVARIHRG